MIPKNIEKYQKYYSDSRFWRKVLTLGRKAGLKVVYAALLLYYLMVDGSVPVKDKIWITGALGYFIFPVDLLPDFLIPPVGFSDDLAVLLFALNKVKTSITPQVNLRAKESLQKFFGQVGEDQLAELDRLCQE